MNFAQQLATGQIGESEIARWLLSKGHSVVPVYEKEIGTGKGPRYFTPDKQCVAPDMLLLPKGNAPPIWIEAKHKSVFSWHRRDDCWCTGIDLHHYQEYLDVEARSGRPVWLLFLHKCDQPDDRDIPHCFDERCPVGLFGNSLTYLMQHENHRSDKHGNHGMVYWAHEHLRLLETLEGMKAQKQ
jgi:hypothetical protein